MRTRSLYILDIATIEEVPADKTMIVTYDSNVDGARIDNARILGTCTNAEVKAA